MKALCAVLSLAAISICAVECAADDEVAKRGQREVLVVAIQDLDLTDEQEAKIGEIREEFGPKVQEAAKTERALVKEEVEKLSAVLTAEQRQQVQAQKEEREDRREECLAHRVANLKELELTDAEMAEIGQIREEYRPQTEKAAAVLAELLSEDQKKARAEALSADKKRKEVLQSLKLTNEQRESLAGAARELGSNLKKELQKIGAVLDAGQKEKLQEERAERKEQARDRKAHRIANAQELKLTDEQKEKLSTIRQEYRPKIHEAGNKLRATIRDEVQMIAAVIK